MAGIHTFQVVLKAARVPRTQRWRSGVTQRTVLRIGLGPSVATRPILAVGAADAAEALGARQGCGPAAPAAGKARHHLHPPPARSAAGKAGCGDPSGQPGGQAAQAGHAGGVAVGAHVGLHQGPAVAGAGCRCADRLSQLPLILQIPEEQIVGARPGLLGAHDQAVAGEAHPLRPALQLRQPAARRWSKLVRRAISRSQISRPWS